MRIVSYGAACSLDGFIAGVNGEIDWLHFSKDVQDITKAYWKPIDTILMGRKTWDASVAMGGGGGAGVSSKIATYVFSRTLKSVTQPGVQLVASDPGDFVRELKGKPGKDICVMGGGELAQSLLGSGAIDEVGLNVHPILLGAGIPLFRDPGRRVRLELKESRTIDGGCVYSMYRVVEGR